MRLLFLDFLLIIHVFTEKPVAQTTLSNPTGIDITTMTTKCKKSLLSLAQALGKGQPSRDLVRSLQLQPVTQQRLQACYAGNCRAPSISQSSVSGIKLLRPSLS